MTGGIRTWNTPAIPGDAVAYARPLVNYASTMQPLRPDCYCSKRMCADGENESQRCYNTRRLCRSNIVYVRNQLSAVPPRFRVVSQWIGSFECFNELLAQQRQRVLSFLECPDRSAGFRRASFPFSVTSASDRACRRCWTRYSNFYSRCECVRPSRWIFIDSDNSGDKGLIIVNNAGLDNSEDNG